jgi:hypothetical protein
MPLAQDEIAVTTLAVVTNQIELHVSDPAHGTQQLQLGRDGPPLFDAANS